MKFNTFDLHLEPNHFHHWHFNKLSLVPVPLSDLDHCETNHMSPIPVCRVSFFYKIRNILPTQKQKKENILSTEMWKILSPYLFQNQNDIITSLDNERFSPHFIRFFQTQLDLFISFSISFFFHIVNDIDGFCVVKFISIWWSKMILGRWMKKKNFISFWFTFLCFYLFFSSFLSHIDLISSLIFFLFHCRHFWVYSCIRWKFYASLQCRM